MPTTTMATRDSQRQRVYDAEQLVRRIFDRADDAEARHGPAARQVEVYGSVIVLPAERKFADIGSVQRYVDAVLDLAAVRSANPRPQQQVKVRARKGTAFAHYERYGRGGPTIAMPDIATAGLRRWAMREIVVLHEIAHHLNPTGQASHGPSFVGAFLTLVDVAMGAEAAFVLRAVFLDGGVNIA